MTEKTIECYPSRMGRPRSIRDDDEDERKPTSVRLSTEDFEIMELLQKHLGLGDRASTIRYAIRRVAKDEGVWKPSGK